MFESDNFTHRVLQSIQTDLTEIKSTQLETNRKLGTMAETLVRHGKRLDEIANDLRMVAMAVDDEHTARIEKLENQTSPLHT